MANLLCHFIGLPRNEFVIIILAGYDILASLPLIFLDICEIMYETNAKKEGKKKMKKGREERNNER